MEADFAARLGVRERRREFRAGYPDVFVWPPRPLGVMRWLFGFPGFLWPWNVLYLAVSAGVWWWATPDRDSMSSWSPGWVAVLAVRNLVLAVAWFGMFHWCLYRRRTQDDRGRFNARWPGSSDAFAFGTQVRDNVFWALASGVPIWTAWEAVTWWLAASGRISVGDVSPAWFVGLLVLIPLFREIHFYAVHRAIHWPPLYRAVHSLHHRNTNPSPWSGLSMHPVEHVAYFSAVAVLWVVPAHPLHVVFILVHLGFAPAPGHAGFERFELGRLGAVPSGGYAHYLHHKLFEVNYADGVFPLDRWFGSFHDGSPEADERLKQRRRARSAALRAAASADAG
jgi:sterol desaturase/sphingolipid hydroxylase (fatty acid hydroxylase superfamily)